MLQFVCFRFIFAVYEDIGGSEGLMSSAHEVIMMQLVTILNDAVTSIACLSWLHRHYISWQLNLTLQVPLRQLFEDPSLDKIKVYNTHPGACIRFWASWQATSTALNLVDEIQTRLLDRSQQQ